MDGARIVTLAQRGYGLAGRKVGLPHDHYRPVQRFDPLRSRGHLGVVLATFDRLAKFPFTASPGYGEAGRYALLDGTAVQHGDYLVGPTGDALFVARPGGIHATLCIACNATLSMQRVAPPAAVGVVGYRAQAALEDPWITGWPASVLTKGRGAKPETGLPGAVPAGEWTVLLPKLIDDAVIRSSDVLAAEDGRRFVVEQAEATDLGWRLTARSLVAG